MTCRSEIIDAFRALAGRSGRNAFSPLEIIQELERNGTSYPPETIRTHIVAHMCRNASGGNPNGELERIDRGTYQLVVPRPATPAPRPARTPGAVAERITEDEVKAAVLQHLEAAGWRVAVAWDRERGADIIATRGNERLVLEAKGEAPAGPQQVNYFLGALGELIQRMDDPDAEYGLALPGHRQYRGLVDRLPDVAVSRLGLHVLYVVREDGELVVEEHRR